MNSNGSVNTTLVIVWKDTWTCPKCGHFNYMKGYNCRIGDTLQCSNRTPLLNGRVDFRGQICRNEVIAINVDDKK